MKKLLLILICLSVSAPSFGIERWSSVTGDDRGTRYLLDYQSLKKLGWLGVRAQEITPDIAKALGLKNEEGALISMVNPRETSEKAGINVGDVILEINGKKINDVRTLQRTVADLAVSSSASVSVWRNKKIKKLTVKIDGYYHIWGLWSHSYPIENRIFSSEIYYQVDCKLIRLRITNDIHYNDRMGSGEVIAQNVADKNWQGILQGSVNEELIRRICRRVKQAENREQKEIERKIKEEENRKLAEERRIRLIQEKKLRQKIKKEQQEKKLKQQEAARIKEEKMKSLEKSNIKKSETVRVSKCTDRFGNLLPAQYAPYEKFKKWYIEWKEWNNCSLPSLKKTKLEDVKTYEQRNKFSPLDKGVRLSHVRCIRAFHCDLNDNEKQKFFSEATAIDRDIALSVYTESNKYGRLTNKQGMKVKRCVEKNDFQDSDSFTALDALAELDKLSKGGFAPYALNQRAQIVTCQALVAGNKKEKKVAKCQLKIRKKVKKVATLKEINKCK